MQLFSTLTEKSFLCKTLEFAARMLMTFRFDFLFETEKAFKNNAI